MRDICILHRILTPDGAVFDLSETINKAEPTPAGESPETGSLATPISSASNNRISQTVPGVNTVSENFVQQTAGSDAQAVFNAYEDILARGTNAAADPVGAAVEAFQVNGTVTNKQATDILNNSKALQALRDAVGLELPETSSGRRNAIKEAVAQLAELSAVDAETKSEYNKSRSEQVSSAIERLNRGGTDSPTLEEIMVIPEIAAAERANMGTETISLPNREGVRKNAYDKAMQKGSWNGSSYSGVVRHDERMDIVIGLPGSGKSSVYTEPLSQEHKSRVIDTDDFRDYIPEYNGTNAAVVHEEASEIRDRVFETAVANGDNILLSTIGANAEKLADNIKSYKELGYNVYLHLNELPNSKSLARAIGRYIAEDGTLDRYVSPKLIAEYGDKPTQTYLYLTGQGGNGNGKLDGNLRESRGSAYSNVEKTSGATSQRTAVPTDLLSGYDWYNNHVKRGEAPRLIQSSESATDTTPSAESREAMLANPSVGAADQNFTGRAAYQDLLTDKNSQRDRLGDVRPVEVPKVDGYGRQVSEFVGNAYGSAVVPDDFTAIIEE